MRRRGEASTVFPNYVTEGEIRGGDWEMKTELESNKGNSPVPNSTLIAMMIVPAGQNLPVWIQVFDLIVRKRILVVESPPEVLVKILSLSGHLVLGATSLLKAADLWDRSRGGFDMVIIDDRTGVEDELIPKVIASKPTVRVILMSGKKERNGLPEGVLVLGKPVSPKTLNEAVDP